MGSEDNMSPTVVNQMQRELNDADLLILLCPISRNKHPSVHHLIQTVVDRSLTGKHYMEGGGLGLITVGVENDPRATLNIRQSVDMVVSQLMQLLMVPVISQSIIHEPPVLRLEVEYDKCGCRSSFHA